MLLEPNGGSVNESPTPGVPPPPVGLWNLPVGSPSALATAADIPTTSPIKSNHMDSRHVRMSTSSHTYAAPDSASVTPNLRISVMFTKSCVFSSKVLCRKLAYHIRVKGFAYVWHSFFPLVKCWLGVRFRSGATAFTGGHPQTLRDAVCINYGIISVKRARAVPAASLPPNLGRVSDFL